MLSQEEYEKLPKKQQEELMQKCKEIQDLQKGIDQEDSALPQMSMKQFEETIQGAMSSYIKGMTPTDKKYFVFPGIGNDAKLNDNIEPEGKFAKTSKFLKAMIGKDVQTLSTMHEATRVKANLSEGTTTAGGFLVPEEFRAEIMRLAPLYGVVRSNARIIPMKYDTINIPAAGATDQSAIWTNEAASILQTDPNFRQLVLTINKLAAIPKVTNELLADANVEVVSYLAQLISEAFAKEEDNQGFNGTGSPFTGVLSATGVPETGFASGTAMSQFSYPDLVKATTNIYDNAAAGGKFYFHRSVIGHLRSLISTTGSPILLPGQNEIAGFPFVSTEIIPGLAHASASTGTLPFAIFGDLRRGLAMGERGSMTMKISEEATVAGDNLFQQDMAALRMIERVALGVLLPSAFTKITT